MIKLNKITDLSGLHKKLGKIVKGLKADVSLDLDKFTLVDTATAQLLLVFSQSVSEKGFQVSWVKIPSDLHELVTEIGFSEALAWAGTEA